MDDYTFALYFIGIVTIGVAFLIWIGFRIWQTKMMSKTKKVNQELIEKLISQQNEIIENQQKILKEISKINS